MHSGVLRCISSPAGRAAAWHNWKAGFLLKAHPGHRAARSETEAGLAEKQQTATLSLASEQECSGGSARGIVCVVGWGFGKRDRPRPFACRRLLFPQISNAARNHQSPCTSATDECPCKAIFSRRPSLKAAVHPPANLGLRRPALGRYSTPLPQTEHLRDFKMTRRARK